MFALKKKAAEYGSLAEFEKNRELAGGDANTGADAVERRNTLQGGQQGPRSPNAAAVESSGTTARDRARARLEQDHARHLDNIENKGVPRDEIRARTDMGERPFEELDGYFNKDGDLTKDDLQKFEADVQKITDKIIVEVDRMRVAKEADILEV